MMAMNGKFIKPNAVERMGGRLEQCQLLPYIKKPILYFTEINDESLTMVLMAVLLLMVQQNAMKQERKQTSAN
jgi:hypothetical protein